MSGPGPVHSQHLQNLLADHQLLRRDVLAEERERSSFPVREMTHLLDGGEEQTRERKRFTALANEPQFQPTTASDRLTCYQHGMNVGAHFIKAASKLKTREEFSRFFYSMRVQMPFDVHWSMFVPNLLALASAEQKAYWLPKAIKMEVIGAYAQTELGNGSAIRALETTATYIPETEEFELNTPSLTGMKWWPGGLGKCANHCVCHAQLILNGRNMGLHTFILPIRDMKTHASLPGITLGDIGSKFGWNGFENGFMAIDHVRIPRRNLLAKHVQVTAAGKYERSKAPTQAQYVTMVQTRASIVQGSGVSLARAVTIACRYSAVRTIASTDADGFIVDRTHVIDFTTQQARLFSHLAAAYAFWFTSRAMNELYIAFLARSRDPSNPSAFDILPLVHATSSGLKAITTSYASAAIEDCRRACGGHGFSDACGIGKLYLDFVPACTYEGDNFVLLQQTGRYLLKSLAGQTKDRDYLSRELPTRCPYASEDDFLCPAKLVEMFQSCSRLLALAAQAAIAARTGSEESKWNSSVLAVIRLVKVHCHCYILEKFAEEIAKPTTHASLRPVLTRLCALHALSTIESYLGEFLETGYMTSAHATIVHALVLRLLREIRPDVISLCDAFDFADHQLSILGRADGDAYTHYVQWALKSPLNKTDVVEGHAEAMGPLRSHL
eukprot:gnl/Spiro4/14217_TR7641_c0_g1_i1.p1 gnl/Spiro4/14217_TR7641_c0_g1~~gnl/Spiro4/14217_TR7641_c0_g1_i1.p1  ORF type:complete len:680 (+),score=124.87 gnl/Spiro4/14217_TR7641_c0_g1_i1:32-2041(+)